MKKTNERGITVISLILTIVILLIIACVIDIVVSDDLFDKVDKVEEDIMSDIADSQNKVDNIIESLPVISESLSISSVTLNSKTTNSFVVDVLATSSEEGNLTYSLYLEGNSTPVRTKTVEQDGSVVQLTADGLAEYTEYKYYVKITDSSNSIQSKVSTVRTKCSGKTKLCITEKCSGKGTADCLECENGTWKCSKCDGAGVYCATCKGSGSATCGGVLERNPKAGQTVTSWVCGVCKTNKYYTTPNFYYCSDCINSRLLL